MNEHYIKLSESEIENSEDYYSRNGITLPGINHLRKTWEAEKARFEGSIGSTEISDSGDLNYFGLPTFGIDFNEEIKKPASYSVIAIRYEEEDSGFFCVLHCDLRTDNPVIQVYSGITVELLGDIISKDNYEKFPVLSGFKKSIDIMLNMIYARKNIIENNKKIFPNELLESKLTPFDYPEILGTMLISAINIKGRLPISYITDLAREMVNVLNEPEKEFLIADVYNFLNTKASKGNKYSTYPDRAIAIKELMEYLFIGTERKSK